MDQRTEKQKQILANFEIPEAASGLLDFFFTPWEQDLIAAYGGKEFAEGDLSEEEIAREYHRGVISKVNDEGTSYRLNNFYGFLDVFCVSRKEKYDQLTMAQKRALDDWYFDAYYEGLDTQSGCPTPDRVLPLPEMLEVIDNDPRPIYLNFCDCRSLTGECGLPTRTCLTWKDGVNSFVDRGLSQALTKEEAREVVRMADAAGLMHTTMGQCICNCCGDCCYLFRAQRRLGSVGSWPRAKYIVSLKDDLCIGCGKCASRCHLGVFILQGEKGHRKVSADPEKCAGCGLCTSACPRGALTLTPRSGRSQD